MHNNSLFYHNCIGVYVCINGTTLKQPKSSTTSPLGTLGTHKLVALISAPTRSSKCRPLDLPGEDMDYTW